MMEKFSRKFWFKVLSEKKNVLQLVRGLLGCSCPDEVFEHYQVKLNGDGPAARIQLILSNRLLLEILDMEKGEVSREDVLELLEKGRKLRDRLGLNRFRLVLTGGSSPDSPKPGQLPTISEPNVHLHILTGDMIKNIFDS